MSNVPRWTTDSVHESESGGFVAYGDYLQLEQRMKVLTDAVSMAEKYLAERVSNSGIIGRTVVLPALREVLKQTPQQTAAQIERGHIEWMMKLPVFAYSYKSSKGHDISTHEFCDDVLALCPADMVVSKLVAIPPLPKDI